MTSAISPLPDTSEDEGDFQAIYQHVKRPEWGVAIIAWDRGNKRGYQFDDGTLRIFKKGYYNLLKEVDPPEGMAGELLDELNRRLHESMEKKGSKKKSKPLEPVYPFEDQLTIFTKLYAGGFDDPKWVEKIRGQGSRKRLKRHRDSAIEQAREMLAKDRLDSMIESGQHAEVWRSALEVLDSTNLAGRAQIKAVRETMERRERVLATTLRDLLYGEIAYGRRFANFIRGLRAASDKKPSWRIATAIPALVLPEKQVCVRPSTFRKQAGEMAPKLVYTTRPRRKSYRSFRKVAKATRRKLLEEGFKPRDYLDIHDFIWATLRPAAAKHLDD